MRTPTRTHVLLLLDIPPTVPRRIAATAWEAAECGAVEVWQRSSAVFSVERVPADERGEIERLSYWTNALSAVMEAERIAREMAAP